MLTPETAHSVAASWGSFMRSGDPGACFYGFSSNFVVQSAQHRKDCLAHAAECIAATRKPGLFPKAVAERAQLRMLKRAIRAAPLASDVDLAKVDDFTRGYLDAAVWTDCSPDAEGGAADLTVAFLSPAAIKDAVAHCSTFKAVASDLLAQAERRGRDLSHLGHDFWLTCNGHGTGFWDRADLEADGLGDDLTRLAQRCGEASLYAGDDGRLYFM